MHDSAFESFIEFQDIYLSKLNINSSPKIIEIGSYSVNSNIKKIVSKKFEYIGLDILNGPNVDIVLDNPYKFPFEDNEIDAVISISTFEHTDFFWLSYLEVLRVLKPKGLFYLNAPSNSKYHRHPGDSWRFYPDSSISLIKWGKQNNFNPEVLEHYTNFVRNLDIWNDYVAITIKDKSYKDFYQDRILDKKKFFTNGRTDRSDQILNFKELPQDQSNWGWKIHYKFRKKLYKLKKLLKFYN